MLDWLETELGRQVLSSAILVALVVLMRLLAARAIKRSVHQPELRGGWLVSVRSRMPLSPIRVRAGR